MHRQAMRPPRDAYTSSGALANGRLPSLRQSPPTAHNLVSALAVGLASTSGSGRRGLFYQPNLSRTPHARGPSASVVR
jgi:hypothetical protein